MAQVPAQKVDVDLAAVGQNPVSTVYFVFVSCRSLSVHFICMGTRHLISLRYYAISIAPVGHYSTVLFLQFFERYIVLPKPRSYISFAEHDLGSSLKLACL